MIIGTFNVRGCNNLMKQKRICQIMGKRKPDVMFIQETNIGKMSGNIVNKIWGGEDCLWSAKEAGGRAGGILTIWRKDSFTPIFSFQGNGFLGIKGTAKGMIIYFINVYSPCNLADKRELWEELLGWKNKLEVGEWVVGGDFNSIKNREKRRGVENFCRVHEMEEFKDFIENLEVIDVQVVGNIFTWIKPNGRASSRLDRIMLSEGLISCWDIVAQEVGKRDISDHKPVWTKSSRMDWGPKVFKVLRCWYEHKDFIPFVQNEWSSLDVRGSKAFVLKEKMKKLRERMRWWNTNVFGKIDLKIEEDVEALNATEDRMTQMNVTLTEEEIKEKRRLQESFWKNLHTKESILRQKSGLKWTIDGDNNSRFFHSTMKSKSRRKAILVLKNASGQEVESATEIK
ncbi:uncharacterized protein LOC131644810 [Vicia villosa]|uniref:uncharacterized protein LOC131644810 n=1 Tax=Vicia villosa TaxID=3911 RepID=UPI00273B74CA|nr:uncharacterized protein LOC131644810 [Vicia villosa]